MLIEILSEEDTVSAADLERAAERQRERGGSLAEWLLRIGVLAEDDLFFLLSRRLGVPPIPEERLRHLTLAPELRRRVPRGFAEQWVVLPLDVDVAGASLSVAMLDPSDESTLEALRLRARVSRVRTYLARRSVILAAIERVYDAAEAEHDLDRTEPPPRLMAAVPGRRDEVFGLAAELAPTFARDDGGDGGLGDLRPGDTQVSMIPGKVEIDPMLAQEIAALGEGAVDDDDDGLDDAELFATRIKKVPSNELPAARHALQQPARRPAGMPPVPPPTRFNPGEERQLHGRSLLADARGGAPLDNSRTAALQRVPSASPPPIPPETPAPEPLTPEPEPASSEV
ncbi:MAG: hypothetical protein KC503_46390, partial [Myxococcales bacterium]|nr:hypothetical protein [Myxococcales bacterium]